MQYLDQLKRKTLVENSVDFSTTGELFGTDFRACSFDTLLQVLSKCCDHSTPKYTPTHQILLPNCQNMNRVQSISSGRNVHSGINRTG